MAVKSSLSVKEDGGYDFDSATPVVIGANGETQLFTDEKGHLVTIPIPYGTYVVIETVTPHNMETIKPFEVHVTENHPTEPQVWRVFVDREFTAKLRVIKKDADTKMTVLIPNTEFKIFNMDTNKYVEMITTYPSKKVHTSFFTDADGDLILEEKAKQAGMTESQYLRLMISQKPNDYPEVRQLLRDLINEVNRIGVNINQITHNHNAELYSKDDKERLIAYMRKLNVAVAKVVDIVGNQ